MDQLFDLQVIYFVCGYEIMILSLPWILNSISKGISSTILLTTYSSNTSYTPQLLHLEFLQTNHHHMRHCLSLSSHCRMHHFPWSHWHTYPPVNEAPKYLQLLVASNPNINKSSGLNRPKGYTETLDWFVFVLKRRPTNWP